MTQPVFNPPHMNLDFDPQGDPKKPWVTKCEHSFSLYSEGLYSNVPEGFRTDLTSYPRWLVKVLLALWPFSYWFAWIPLMIGLVATLGLLIMDPYGRHQRAAMHHDYGYAEGGLRFAKDSAYRVIMAVDGVNTCRRLINYFGVRAFGWIHFDKGDRRGRSTK